ncbi:MAG: competence protein ComK [Paenisporosarcina sp.]
MHTCDSLRIDTDTLVIQPIFENALKTHIITTHGSYTSSFSQLELLNLACMRYFSTYEGRIQASRFQTSFHRKTPLLVAENGIEAFPTMSPLKPDCMWIFNHTFKVKFHTNKSTLLQYENGIEIVVNASIHTIEKQRSRMIMMIYKHKSLIRI